MKSASGSSQIKRNQSVHKASVEPQNSFSLILKYKWPLHQRLLYTEESIY